MEATAGITSLMTRCNSAPLACHPACFYDTDDLVSAAAAPFGAAQQPRQQRAALQTRCEAQRSDAADQGSSLARRNVLGGALAAAAALAAQPQLPAFANQDVSDEWEKVRRGPVPQDNGG